MSHKCPLPHLSLPPQGPSDSLGVSIAGGKGSPLGDIPIFIAMIQDNGVAAKTHRVKVIMHLQLSVHERETWTHSNECVCVQVGDRIVSINSVCVDGLSHGDVVSMLKNSYGNISLQVTGDSLQCTRVFKLISD